MAIEEHDSMDDNEDFELDKKKFKALGDISESERAKTDLNKRDRDDFGEKPWLSVDNPHIWESI